MKFLLTAAALIAGLTLPAGAAPPVADPPIVLAQAMVPPTGMDDADKPMPMAERMNRRFPQPVRVGDLIGLPVLDDRSSTLGFVRQVVRTAAGKIELIVSYSRWFGWFGAAGRGADRSGRHRGTATGVARYGAQRIRRCADLAGPGRDGAARTTRRSRIALAPQLRRSRLCEADNFLVFPDLYGVRRK